MALNTYIANFRLGKLTFYDGTGVPLSFESIYEPGDFSVENLVEGGKEVTDYKDRGTFQSLVYTNQLYPTWSVTAWVTALLGAAGAGNVGVPDIVCKLGGWSAAVSTLGASTGLPFTFDAYFQLEGTDVGGYDSTLRLDDNRGTLAFAEGDPNQFTITGTCYGSVTLTKV